VVAAGWETYYPESALLGAFVAGDAVDPEDVAAGVHLHVVLLGRRPDLDLGVVEPARRARRPRFRPGKPTGTARGAETGCARRRGGREGVGAYPLPVGRPRPPRGTSAAARRRPWRPTSWARWTVMLAARVNLRCTWNTPVAAAPWREASAARRSAAATGAMAGGAIVGDSTA
jgi:hypothetical protein